MGKEWISRQVRARVSTMSAASSTAMNQTWSRMNGLGSCAASSVRRPSAQAPGSTSRSRSRPGAVLAALPMGEAPPASEAPTALAAPLASACATAAETPPKP